VVAVAAVVTAAATGNAIEMVMIKTWMNNPGFFLNLRKKSTQKSPVINRADLCCSVLN